MQKIEARYEKQNSIFLLFILFGLIFVRYCYYGFEYYYQLDDYIQYHNYAAFGGSFKQLVTGLGLLANRPLAGLFDIYVWSRLYGQMIAAAADISIMYAVAALLLYKVFSKRFGTGYLFLVVFALMPLGFEGTYWVSASSRIVVGMFFASLSFYFFDKWCDKGTKRYLVLFAVMQFIAFCFYEQILLFSGALTLIAMLGRVRGQDRVRARWGFLMFGNAALYFGFTALMPKGVYSSRTELFLPWQKDYVKDVLTPLLNQLKMVFIDGSGATFGKGLVRGFKFIVTEPNALWALVVMALCFVVFIFVRNSRRDSIRFFAELFSGLFLAIAPLLLFFVLKDPWFGMRNSVVSFCGLGLVLDALFDLIFGRVKSGRFAEAVFVAVLALVCCVASVSELHDYRETTLADTQIATAAGEAFRDMSFKSTDKVWLLNVDPTYVADGNLYYHEHDYGVTSSSWALTGAISAVCNRGDIPSVYPITAEKPFLEDESVINSAISFWYDGERIIPVTFSAISYYEWEIRDASGTVLGTLAYIYEAFSLEKN